MVIEIATALNVLEGFDPTASAPNPGLLISNHLYPFLSIVHIRILHLRAPCTFFSFRITSTSYATDSMFEYPNVLTLAFVRFICYMYFSGRFFGFISAIIVHHESFRPRASGFFVTIWWKSCMH